MTAAGVVLAQNATVVQMFPYGWQLAQPNNLTGAVVREAMYMGMATALGGHYSRWVNPFPHNAFLHKDDFEKLGEVGALQRTSCYILLMLHRY